MAERIKTQAPPKKRNAARSREKILLTAEALFAEHGPQASVDLIAEKSHLNKRMVYHYFGSKEGLWQAVLVRQYEKVAKIEANLSRLKSLPDVTSELVSRYYRFLSEDPGFVKILMHENLFAGRHMKNLPVAKTKAPVLLALERALKAGKIKDMDPSHLLVDCLALCFFYFSNQATLSATFGTDMSAPAAINARIEHVRKVVRLITSRS